jgi:hypothetical protein
MLHFSPDQVKVTLREETMGGPSRGKQLQNHLQCAFWSHLNTCKLLILLVGAGRFERPTPCAQGRSVSSKGSIRYGPFFMFTTTWGICFSLRSKPKTYQEMEFWHSFGTVVQIDP